MTFSAVFFCKNNSGAFGKSTTITSVVVMSDAMLEASTSAERTTLVGSMMPAATKSQYSPVCALYL